MKKVLSFMLSLLLLCGILAVPARAAEASVLPKKARDSYGNEITYQLQGTTLSIERSNNLINELDDNFDEGIALYPFLNTCTPEDRNTILALNYGEAMSPILIFSLSSLIRSGKIRTINYFDEIYKFTVVDGKVTKVVIDFGWKNKPSTTIKYDHGRFSGYFIDYGVDCESVSVKYSKDGVKSGNIGNPYFVYDFTSTLKNGNIDKVEKKGMTSFSDYKASVNFSFSNNRVSTVVDDSENIGYDRIHVVTRYFYNPDGNLSSVDFRSIDESYDNSTGKITQTDRTDSYFAYVY